MPRRSHTKLSATSAGSPDLLPCPRGPVFGPPVDGAELRKVQSRSRPGSGTTLIDPVEGTELVLRPDEKGSPDDPRQMFVVAAAVAELLALTSSSPAATAAGLLA